MTEQEKVEFIRKGREHLTALAYGARVLREWTESFTQRGGQPVFGDDATLIANLSNYLNGVGLPEGVDGFLDSGRRALIARLRTDV